MSTSTTLTDHPHPGKTSNGFNLAHHLHHPGNNNFNLIRLLAAISVLISHTFEFLDGRYDPVYRVTGLFNASYIGLCTFFFLSGMLVTASLDHSPTWKNFLWRRFIRLVPAVVVLTLICAFIAGPLLTTLPLGHYFTDPEFFQFLSSICMIRFHYTLPGVWQHSPYGADLTGPLWSIALEIKLYAGLLLFNLIRSPIGRPLAFSFLLAAIASHAFFYADTRQLLDNFLHVSNSHTYTVLAPLFVAGSLCYRYSDRFSTRWKNLLYIAPAVALLAWLKPLTATTFFIIPIAILYIGTHGMQWLRRLTPRADLSYAIYIYGDLVGKITFIYIHPRSAWTCFFITLAILTPIACLSWYLVEKPALRHKTRFA